MNKRRNAAAVAEAPIKPMDSDVLPPEFRKADKPFGMELHVFNFIIGGLLTHACLAYWLLYLIPFGYVSTGAVIFGLTYGYLSGLGITVGCHRYWTHKTFKANRHLQIILMFMQTASFQHTIFKWCRDHRVHHKFMDSNADPHSAARGFWYSHITWLFYPRHPDLVKSLKTVEISDLANDPIVRFQSKYYWELLLVIFFIVPMTIYHILFPEMSWFHNFVNNMARYGVSLHFTFLVNSVAHKFGDKPYDKYITPTENKFVSLLAVGEGWHNYHHTFPWDYKSAEFGYKFNLSTVFIHFFAMIGWAWDMKTVSHKLLSDRINRTGDGSHPLHNHNNNNAAMKDDKRDSVCCWGWGDENLKKEDVEITETLFPSMSRRG